MAWQDQLKGDSLSWLLESAGPGVRYLALRDLLDRPPDDPDLCAARQAAHTQGPIAAILAEMAPGGYWVHPGAGYSPKYRATVWATLALAQLGAVMTEDARIAQACAYLLDHTFTAAGQASISGAPSGVVDCLHGNLVWALLALGCDDPRLEPAFEWIARSVTGEGVAPASDRQAPVHYYSVKCGPDFVCGYNHGQPCAWGCVKLLLALGKWPQARYTPLLHRALQRGVDYLLSVEPAEASYPIGNSGKPSQNWWKFGFPVFYVTDLLQLAEALEGVGYGADPRLAGVLALIRDKQDVQGRWALDYDYTGKTWADFGAKRQLNPWVTLRALRVLKACG